MTTLSMNWEPLPPRETSSRQQRRRARGEMAKDSSSADNKNPAHQNQQKSQSKQKGGEKPKRKPNRPGFNSYLKVLLDDTTMDRLHDVAKRIQQKVQGLQKDEDDETITNDDDNQAEKENANEEATATLEDKEKEAKEVSDGECKEESTAKEPATAPAASKDKKQRKQRPLSFKARSRASLHMTFFFGGENLCELPPEELQDWYNKVRDRLETADFVLQQEKPTTTNVNDEPDLTKEPGNAEKDEQQASTEPDNNNKPQEEAAAADDNSNANETTQEKQVPTTVMTGDYWFDVTDVRLFPPGRNNLIVAHLEATPAWHVLHNDIREIAKVADSELLNDVVSYSKDKWTAHITMGNIFGGGSKAEVRTAFTKVLGEVSEELIHEYGSTPPSTTKDTNDGDAKPSKTTKTASLFKATTYGIGMGGPVPKQIDLDWDFVYQPKE